MKHVKSGTYQKGIVVASSVSDFFFLKQARNMQNSTEEHLAFEVIK